MTPSPPLNVAMKRMRAPAAPTEMANKPNTAPDAPSDTVAAPPIPTTRGFHSSTRKKLTLNHTLNYTFFTVYSVRLVKTFKKNRVFHFAFMNVCVAETCNELRPVKPRRKVYTIV